MHVIRVNPTLDGGRSRPITHESIPGGPPNLAPAFLRVPLGIQAKRESCRRVVRAQQIGRNPPAMNSESGWIVLGKQQICRFARTSGADSVDLLFCAHVGSLGDSRPVKANAGAPAPAFAVPETRSWRPTGPCPGVCSSNGPARVTSSWRPVGRWRWSRSMSSSCESRRHPRKAAALRPDGRT